MRTQPITLRDARRFIAAHHRHNQAPGGWLFGVSLVNDQDEVRAVGVAGRPKGRGLQTGRAVEITRVCTLGDHNAASMVYGALCTAAEALGYEVAYTYTLAEEPGISPKAAGFEIDAEIDAREAWEYTGQARVQVDLFGDDRRPPGKKIRWKRVLRPTRMRDAPAGEGATNLPMGRDRRGPVTPSPL